jgi:hypothetical protein
MARFMIADENRPPCPTRPDSKGSAGPDGRRADAPAVTKRMPAGG